MKKWFRQYWRKALIILTIIVFALILIIGIPLFLNWLYKTPAPLEFLRTEWEADAALSYYGTIVAALITILGVFLTIQYSQRNYHEDARNKVRPFFAIKILRSSIRPNWDYDEKDGDGIVSEGRKSGYSEEDARDYYITVSNGIIKGRTYWTREQRKLLNSGGVATVLDGMKMQQVGYLILPIVAENVGNGPALYVRFAFNRKQNGGKKKYFRPVPAKTGDKISIHVFFDYAMEDSQDLGEYSIEIEYQDIFENSYCQAITVELKYDSEFGDVVCASYGGEQHLVHEIQKTDKNNTNEK